MEFELIGGIAELQQSTKSFQVCTLIASSPLGATLSRVPVAPFGTSLAREVLAVVEAPIAKVRPEDRETWGQPVNVSVRESGFPCTGHH